MVKFYNNARQILKINLLNNRNTTASAWE